MAGGSFKHEDRMVNGTATRTSAYSPTVLSDSTHVASSKFAIGILGSMEHGEGAVRFRIVVGGPDRLLTSIFGISEDRMVFHSEHQG